MTILSVSDAACMAGVKLSTINSQIDNGILSRTPEGVDVSELIRVYPDLKPLTGLKLRSVKRPPEDGDTHLVSTGNEAGHARVMIADSAALGTSGSTAGHLESSGKSNLDKDTVDLLVRELEWNKELLEQTNQLMTKQLADQRALIADQARRLDEKDRFWARQVEIAQSLLAAPAPRKKFLGLF